MDLVSGAPFWPIRDGLMAVCPPLDQDAACEVAVIGGGITGALVARRLVDAGVDTLLLDRRDIGHGSTAASTSLVQYENDVPLSRLVKLVGEANAVRSYWRGVEAVGELEILARRFGGRCDFAKKESLYLASSPRDLPGLRREYELRKKHGFAVEYWSKGDLAASSSLPHFGALLSKNSAEIDAYCFTCELVRAARQKGLRAFDRTGMTSHRVRPRGVELFTSRGARVRAKKIVIATGYEALADLAATRTALHSTYAAISEPIDRFTGWPGRRLIWETARPYLYLRTTSDGRAIVGGYDEPFRDPVRRDRLLPAKTKLLARRFRQLFPRIDFEVAYSWTGTFAETPDGLPYIGEHPDYPRAYFALGYGGNGITWGVIAADIIADLYLGRKNSDAAIFRFDR
ncbi:MAG TPA: FAD-dependent oxidoreductase [Opitutaceae bacterium]|nr:FAD-dependent oxidoreductase [Opitutaceae bacterium]